MHEALQNMTKLLAAQGIAVASAPVAAVEEPVAVPEDPVTVVVAESSTSQAVVLSSTPDPVVAARRLSVFGSLGSALYGLFGASTTPAKKRQSMPMLSSMPSS